MNLPVYFVRVQSVELTEKAVEFLKGVFVDFDSDAVSLDKMTESVLIVHSLFELSSKCLL